MSSDGVDAAASHLGPPAPSLTGNIQTVSVSSENLSGYLSLNMSGYISLNMSARIWGGRPTLFTAFFSATSVCFPGRCRRHLLAPTDGSPTAASTTFPWIRLCTGGPNAATSFTHDAPPPSAGGRCHGFPQGPVW